MSFKDHEKAQELLRRYEALEEQRQRLLSLYCQAEETGDYSRADEESADINEVLADLADEMADVLRRVTFAESPTAKLHRVLAEEAIQRGEFG